MYILLKNSFIPLATTLKFMIAQCYVRWPQLYNGYRQWQIVHSDWSAIKTGLVIIILIKNNIFIVLGPLETTVWFMIANAMCGGGRFNLTDTAEHTMTDHPFSQSGWIFDFAWKLLADDLLDLIRCLYQLEILTFLPETTQLLCEKTT